MDSAALRLRWVKQSNFLRQTDVSGGRARTVAEKSYCDELMRALARPDAVELRMAVVLYHELTMARGKAREVLLDRHPEGLEALQFASDDPDRGLALVALAASMYDEPNFLFSLAAGPLEDILRRPSKKIIDRIVTEARRNARFRWMLTGIFLHAIADEARPHIVDAIGLVREGDPMPPRSA